MDRAILWNPVKKEGAGRPSGRAPYPVFFQQEAVVALQDHLKASPQQAIFGFLAGTVFRDPETGVLYAVIDKTLRLNQAIYGDKTEVVVARLWDRMQEQLARASGRLLGWYHSHPGQALALTTHDVDTHVKFFTEPWQVAVLVAAETEGVMGGFFRSGSSQAWPETPLAFYELLQPDSIRADGKKRSFITWKNYKAYNPIAAKPAAKPPPPPPPRPRPPPPPPPAAADTHDLPIIRTSADDEAAPARPRAPVFIPDEAPEPPPRPLPPQPPPRRPSPPPPASREGAPARAPRRTPAPSFKLLDQRGSQRRRSRRGLWLTLLALLLIGGGGAAAGYWYFFLRQPGAPLPFGLDSLPFGLGRRRAAPVATPGGTARPPVPAPARAQPPAPRIDTAFARFDGLTDTLSRAVRNYHDRAALFANRQIDCAALARGLVAIENLWINYNAERQVRIASFDARRAARDQGLYAAVDSVESSFERTRCQRP
jgi:proteasome lid subunit RPN8/RPN11